MWLLLPHLQAMWLLLLHLHALGSHCCTYKKVAATAAPTWGWDVVMLPASGAGLLRASPTRSVSSGVPGGASKEGGWGRGGQAGGEGEGEAYHQPAAACNPPPTKPASMWRKWIWIQPPGVGSNQHDLDTSTMIWIQPPGLDPDLMPYLGSPSAPHTGTHGT